MSLNTIQNDNAGENILSGDAGENITFSDAGAENTISNSDDGVENISNGDASGEIIISSGDAGAGTGLITRKPIIQILVVSDVVCPWCWVSKRRLESAMESLSEKFDFSVHYSPFLLRPKCPTEGVPNPDYNNLKDIRCMYVREVGEQLGIDINFLCPIVPYSVPALALRQYVRNSDYPNVVQSQVVEKLYEAYFTKGHALTRDNLLEIAKELMLNLDEVTSYLDDPANEQNVIEQAESWRNQGVQAVPFFFMNGKAVCSGAQDTADFVKTILKVAEKFPGEQMRDEVAC